MFFNGFAALVLVIFCLMAGWFTAYMVKDFLEYKVNKKQMKLCILVSFFVWPLIWIIAPIFGLKELCNNK